jgi:hypothetical protein
MKTTNNGFLKRAIALTYIALLISSVAVIAAISSFGARADAQPTCERLPLADISASAETSSFPAENVMDSNLETRWQYEKIGSYIQTDLGKQTTICSVDIAWHKGDIGKVNFVLSVSDNGKNFVNLVSGKSGGGTLSPERYNVPDVNARYVRATVNGNDANEWAAINEMSVNGMTVHGNEMARNGMSGFVRNTETAINNLIQAQDECQPSQIIDITTAGDDVSTPENTIDDSLSTKWPDIGFPSQIIYDLGTVQPICSVDIAWYRGNLRINTFTVSVSNDGVNFQNIPSLTGKKSSGTTVALESYDITPPISGRYVRIALAGNTENSQSSITEVSIKGQAPQCQPPQIIGITATGNDGNIPENTIDGNSITTRWSNFGLPSQITYNLGTEQPICSVDIAWYRGNLRINTFTVSVSNDGVNFQNIPSLTGKKSSGTTVALEANDITPPVSAKYVRVTVTGNTENNWASISEVAINKRDVTTPPEDCNNGIDDDGDGLIDIADSDCAQPSPEDCDNGIDDDGDGLIDGADPDCAQPSPGGNDPFGIRKIYPTKANGEEWFMDMSDGHDARSDPRVTLTKNSDGSFKVRDTQVRWRVYTSSGYDENEVELDHGVLAQRGYMQSPNDWKNVEMTGYVKVNDQSVQDDENFAWYARGGRHTGSGNPEGCEGSSIKGDLSYDGTSRFAKEQWHVSYVHSERLGPFSDPKADWVGFKTIMWNEIRGGETILRMENWVDANEDGNENGPWVRIVEVTDDGGWGDTGSECGGEDDQIITWGGPIATFRWDAANDVDIKNLSVREIQPPS